MMAGEAQARIKAHVWQAIAETDLDLSQLDKETRSALVDLVTLAAMDAIDDEMGELLIENKDALAEGARVDEMPMDAGEEILWEGRPFLSLTAHYMITNQRIRVATGLFGRSFQNIELVRVQDMDHSQSLGERMINRGDIEIRSHDPHSPIILLENVRDPEAVYEVLRQAVRQARKDQGLTFQEEM
ncbi:MAG: PH domain-containing protein [Candidatus Promineifilaceae bacterium]